MSHNPVSVKDMSQIFSCSCSRSNTAVVVVVVVVSVFSVRGGVYIRLFTIQSISC